MDISNSLGILRAVREAKSVRLVIIFSYLKLGARGELFKGLLSFYSGIVRDLENYLDAFTFCFTHVPVEISLQNLLAIIEDGFK